jgi:CRP-like cAMP-binding protein
MARAISTSRLQTEAGGNLAQLTPAAVLQCVTQAPIYSGLSFADCKEIALLARQRTFIPQQLIFREGDPVCYVWVMASGRAKTTKLSRGGKEVILRVEGPGEVLGGIGLCACRSHYISAQAIENCRVLLWPAAEFDALARRFLGLQRNLVGILAERLRTMEERFHELATERVAQRLARILLRIFGQDQGARQVTLQLSCEELAQMAGTTLFTVSRLLCEWAAQGIIQPQRRPMAVQNYPALLKIAEGRESAIQNKLRCITVNPPGSPGEGSEPPAAERLAASPAPEAED